MTGLVVKDSKNVKILKYPNETKILHGLADLIDENRNAAFGKTGQSGFFTWRSSGIIVLLFLHKKQKDNWQWHMN
jgi:hypothetical protein